RSLTDVEVLDIYKRGALRLSISARSCNDVLCDTEQYISFGSNSTLTNISSLSNNQYFQYKLNFETDNYNYTPELLTDSVVVGYEDAGTCSYSSGNWDVACSDNCSIISSVDVGGNNISITGTGTFVTSANISNFDELYIAGTDETHRCIVTCNGGCFIT
ncbi:MAG: hypothetical protein KKF68_02590, partial [Nanoarchaeota archaeon]|nr:hypothetical protein [Nanoarchaeota archaeon]